MSTNSEFIPLKGNVTLFVIYLWIKILDSWTFKWVIIGLMEDFSISCMSPWKSRHAGRPGVTNIC